MPDIKTDPTESLLTAGQMYDIYVRVHNELGCAPVTNAKAFVYLADPSALSTQWVTITNMQFLSGAVNPTGLVGPGAPGMLGPFTFKAPDMIVGDGHKCLLATVMADGEPAPTMNTTDAPGSNQIAQRNVQVRSCAFPLTNSSYNLSIKLTTTPVDVNPKLDTTPDVEVSFDDADLSWFNVWSAQANQGTDFTVTNGGGQTKVRLGINSVTLSSVTLANGVTRTATASVDIPPGTPKTTLQMQATLTDGTGKVIVSNGGSCDQPAQSIVR